MTKTMIIEKQAAGVAAHAGATPGASDNQRELNTVVFDEIDITAGTVVPNTYVFPVGPYDFEIEAPAYESGGVRAMLWDFTNGVPLILGQSQMSGLVGPQQAAVNAPCKVQGRYVVTAPIEIGVMQRFSLASANGFGAPVNDGRDEIYTVFIASRAV